MEKRAPQVGLAVLGVSVLAALMGVGYLAQTSFSQLYSPPSAANEAAGNLPASNAPQRTVQPAPIPEGVSVWEDYAAESLDNTKRMAERPGNFEIVKKVGEFFEGMYQVEPVMKDRAFPFNNNGKRIESADADAAATKATEEKLREEGRTQINKLRSYNIVIHKTTLLPFAVGESTIENAEALGVNTQRFESVRKDHPERCWLVLLRAGFESLQSEKIEGNRNDADFALCYVLKASGWKLVWFEK